MFRTFRNAPATAFLILSLPCLLPGQGGFSGPGIYEIANLQSRRVLDLDRNDQTTVIQFSSRNTDNQAWSISAADSGYYFIRNAMNGYALEAPETRNSSLLRGAPFTGSVNQQWRIENGKDGNALLVNRASNKAIDVPDGTSRDGVRLQIYDTNGDSNQRFTFRPANGSFGRNSNNRFGGREIARFGGAAPAANSNVPTVTCSSNNGSRVYCAADTSGTVQMVRQISGSPCTQDRTWGYDSRGIWVDRGCRAEFQPVPNTQQQRRGTFGGFGRGNAPTVTCSSSGRRVFCDADTSNGVRLVRQLAGSCVENETWGVGSRGIWVDRGCRGEFALGR